MGSKIEQEHSTQYEQERQDRWGMASNGEKSAIIRICDLFILDLMKYGLINTILMNTKMNGLKVYQTLWFKFYYQKKNIY